MSDSRVCDKNMKEFAKHIFLRYNLLVDKLTDKEAIMTESLERLLAQRKSLFKELAKIGNFRRGTISINYRKCGKKNCACSKEGHPGHGPQFLWSTTIKGKSRTKQLKVGPELRKYIEENDNYRAFHRLCDKIITASEELSNLTLVPEVEDDTEMEELKKNLRRRFAGRYKKKWTG